MDFLATMNNAAINIDAQVCVWTFVLVLLVYTLE
jgi:hypothetical protein